MERDIHIYIDGLDDADNVVIDALEGVTFGRDVINPLARIAFEDRRPGARAVALALLSTAEED